MRPLDTLHLVTHRFRAVAARVAMGAIKLYRITLSPYFGQQCRYYPTCSAYTEEAIGRYGFTRGTWLGAKRLCRCAPWGKGGVDPVPEAPLSRSLFR
jgi:uncharacterized protein